jgi:hypothetical protein
MREGFRGDRRGVSTTLSYVLTLAITAILISGLLAGGATLVENQRETTARAELQVVGQQMVADIDAASRLAVASDGGTARVERRYPPRVVGGGYRIAVEPATSSVTLTSDAVDVSVTVPYVSETPVTAATVGGGPVVVEYDAATDTLEVRGG